MSPQKQYQAYMTATQTVAKTKQIVLLYDGAIRCMQQAREAIAGKRIEDRYHAVTKARDIILGLQGCLDFENGGNIAHILYSYYATIEGNMFSIHRTGSIATCDEVIAELKKMRDVWHEIDQSTTATAAGTVPAANGSDPAPDQNVTLSA
jgi:flagellar protein FliS